MGYIDHSRMPDHNYVYRKEEMNRFVSDYKSCLLELSSIERRILKLWYDTNFQISHTPEEISKKVKLDKDIVISIKVLAMKKIKNNPKMQKYKDIFS